MQARKLLDAAPFEPETINVLKQAFDAAWESIAPSISSDRVDDTTLSLAHAVVAHAGTGDWDCESLKQAALQAVQKHPPRLPPSP
jgi:hypothetical protein